MSQHDQDNEARAEAEREVQKAKLAYRYSEFILFFILLATWIIWLKCRTKGP